MEKLPFSQDGNVRTFSKNVNSNELKWHKDEEDRTIYPLNNNDWLFQRDNQLPEPLDKEIKIQKGEWHRVIKGTTDLEIRILK